MNALMMRLEDFKAARNVLKGVLNDTGLIYSHFFSKATGNYVYLKPENMQVTGAYKIRGAYFTISTLSEQEKAAGLITASAGNHAQGVAYAAKRSGVPATIVMPTTTPPFVSGAGGAYWGITLGCGFNFKQIPHFFIKSSPS